MAKPVEIHFVLCYAQFCNESDVYTKLLPSRVIFPSPFELFFEQLYLFIYDAQRLPGFAKPEKSELE